MGWSVVSFLITLAITAFFLYFLFKGFSELRRLGGFNGFLKFIMIGIVIIIFIFIKPPNWANTLNLDDSQIVTGVLDYQDGGFVLIDSGDDYPDWDFSCCDSISMVNLHCKGKEITVWHNNHVVYQVEKKGKILYSIRRNNIGIVLNNLKRIMEYFWLYCFSLLSVLAVFVPPLREDEKRQEFEDRFITEYKPIEEVQKPIVLQPVIKNISHANTNVIQPTPKQPPNIRSTISKSLSTISSDEGKIVKRFCKHCGAELGKIIEIRSSNDTLQELKYEQYKFCSNCGLDSDSNMPIKPRENRGIAWIAFIVTIFIFLTVPFAIITITEGISFLIEFLGILAIICAITWLYIKEKVHECPSCGRLYEKEHFCPNCGTILDGHSS